MTFKYKVVVKYDGNIPDSEFFVLKGGEIESQEPLKLRNVVGLVGDLSRLCQWLEKNGGVNIEITEVET